MKHEIAIHKFMAALPHHTPLHYSSLSTQSRQVVSITRLRRSIGASSRPFMILILPNLSSEFTGKVDLMSHLPSPTTLLIDNLPQT